MTERKQSDTNPDQQKTSEINATEIQTDTTPEEQTLAIFELGRTYIDQGKYQQAADQFLKYINVNSGEAAAYANLGNCYRELEQYADAEKYLNKALEIDSEYTYSLNNLGLVYSSQKEYDKACEQFLKCININPEYKFAYANLGDCYRKLEQYEEAEKYYKKALEIDSEYTAALNNLGLLYSGQKEYDKACEKFLKCTVVDKQYKWAYANLGDCYRKLEQYADAESYYNKALDIDSEYTYAVKNLGLTYLDQNEYHNACDQFLKYINIDPEYKFAYANLAYCYQLLGQFYKAEDTLFKVLDMDSEYIYAINNLGLVYLAQKKYDQAIEQYLKSVNIEPDNKIALSNWRWCLQFLDKTELIEEQDKFISWMNSHPSTDSYTEVGHFFKWQLKDDATSIHYYHQALPLATDEQKFECYYNLGNAYRDAGEIDQSIECFKKASKDKNYIKDWSYGSSLHNLASVLESIGDYAQADKYWNKVIKVYKTLLDDKSRGQDNLSTALYCSMIQTEYEHQYDDALESCERALSINPDELGALAQKNKILQQIREKLIIPVTDCQEQTVIVNQYQVQQNIRQFETLIDRGGIDESAYFSLFEMYFLEEEYEKAQTILQQVIELFIPDSRYYYSSGQLLRKQKRYISAIQNFKTALSYEPNNFEIQNSLAGSYADSKNYSEAEKTYLKLLKQDNKNIDALIGLGENYLSWNELKQQDSDYLDLSKTLLERALQFGTKGIASKRLDIHSTSGNKRKYKDIQLSQLHYSLGYIDIKLYEINGIKNNRDLLNEAKDHFDDACESDPDNQKAIRAGAKLKPLLEINRVEQLDTLGARLVISLAALVLVIVAYVFIYDHTKQAKLSYSLGQSIALLQDTPGLQAQQLNKLAAIKNVKFTDINGLMKALQNIFGTKVFNTIKPSLEQIDLTIIAQTTEPRISATSFAMIAFSCITFIIMGLFLPSLLRVKIGVIELEKNASTQGQMPSSIGLSR